MFQLLKYFDNFDNFTSHSMSLLSSTRKFVSKGLTLSTSNLDIMKNSSHRGEYPAMQSNGPLPQVICCNRLQKVLDLPFCNLPNCQIQSLTMYFPETRHTRFGTYRD